MSAQGDNNNNGKPPGRGINLEVRQNPFKKKVKVNHEFSNVVANEDRAKAYCIAVKPIPPNNLPDGVPKPTIVTGIAYAPIAFAEKRVRDLMGERTETCVPKLNFVKDADISKRSVVLLCPNGLPIGDVGWNALAGKNVVYKKCGLFQAAGLTDMTEQDIEKGARDLANGVFSPLILRLNKDKGITIFESQVPKLRNGQDFRLVRTWSEALEMDSVKCVIREATGVSFPRFLKQNGYNAYAIWPEGQIPIEEYFNHLTKDCLAPADEEKYEKHQQDLLALLAAQQQPQGVPTAASSGGANNGANPLNDSTNTEKSG